MNRWLDQLHLGDCLEIMRQMPSESVDSIVTDPPYGLKFMGKKWDCDVPATEIWEECIRLLKPGGHLLAFAGTRTQHRMACRIEDAGFEIRDMIAWVYGSGFPKSLDVSKAIDKEEGVERKVLGQKIRGDVQKAKAAGHGYLADPANKNNVKQFGYGIEDITTPATASALRWEGWGTALKPALEPITVARKPIKCTVAQNVQKYGTGAINIDGSRIGYEDDCRLLKGGTYGGNRISGAGSSMFGNGEKAVKYGVVPQGRFPANFIHDGSEEVLAGFPQSNGQQGEVKGTEPSETGVNCYGRYDRGGSSAKPRGDKGSAARFFYCAKSSKSERGQGNNHPTVKPIALMRYLCRLVTPPNGIVLDPFAGSSSTLIASHLEGFHFIGIEKDPSTAEFSLKRLQRETAQLKMNIAPKQSQKWGHGHLVETT